MALSTMYPGKNNSPKTTLAADITAAATSMTVADASVLPAPNNIAVIGTSTDAEVVIYTSIVGNVVSGLTRGAGGTTAKAWTAETAVARNFTMYDYKTLCDNVTDLDTRKANAADLGALALKTLASLVADVTGVLPIANGGTGASSASAARTALELGAMALKALIDLTTDVTGVLPVTNGGTGLNASPSVLTNLGSDAAANVMAANPRPGVTGTLGVTNGGTGGSTQATARSGLGITDIATRPNYVISNSSISEGSTLASGTVYFYYT